MFTNRRSLFLLALISGALMGSFVDAMDGAVLAEMLKRRASKPSTASAGNGASLRSEGRGKSAGNGASLRSEGGGNTVESEESNSEVNTESVEKLRKGGRETKQLSEEQVLTLLNMIVNEAYSYLTMVDIEGKYDAISMRQAIIAQKSYLNRCRDVKNFAALDPKNIRKRSATIVNTALANLGIFTPYPFTPRGLEFEDRSHEVKKINFHPMVDVLGDGFDARYGYTRENVFRWSHVDGTKRMNYKKVEDLIPNAMVIDISKSTYETENLEVFFSGADKALSLCNNVYLSGVGACVLNEEVKRIDELTADGIILVEATKEMVPASIRMKYDISDPSKAISPTLGSYGCKIRKDSEPQKATISCARVNAAEVKLRLPTSCRSKYRACPEIEEDKLMKEELRDPAGMDSVGDLFHLLFFEYLPKGDTSGEYKDMPIQQNNFHWSWRQTMKPIVRYVTELDVEKDVDFDMEGALSAISASFQSSIMDLPDCQITFAQVTEDADFSTIGPGIFDDLPLSDLPSSGTIPLCNVADIAELKQLLLTFGTHYVMGATIGGRITTSYQVALSDVVNDDGDAPAVAVAKMIRKLRSEEHMHETPDEIIMHRTHNDQMNVDDGHTFEDETEPAERRRKREWLKKIDDEMYDEREAADSASQDEDTGCEGEGEAPCRHRRTGREDEDISNREQDRIARPVGVVLRSSRSVVGGHRLPVSELGGGPFSRGEIEEWKKTLATYGAPLRSDLVEIQEALKHPLMIRAAYIHCGPNGNIPMMSLQKKWWTDQGKPTKASYDFWSLMFADFFESRRYIFSTSAWDVMKGNECGRMVHRKFYLIKNFIKYSLVKAEGLYRNRKHYARLTFEIKSREVQMERTYEAWNRAMMAVRKVQTGNDLESTIGALWRKVVLAVEKNGISMSSSLYTPLLEFIASAQKFGSACAARCEADRTLYLREVSTEGKSWGKQKLERHEGFVTQPDAEKKSDPFSNLVDIFNILEAMGPVRMPENASTGNETMSGGKDDNGNVTTAAGEIAVPLEVFPTTPTMIANSIMAKCQDDCAWRKKRIVDTPYGVRNQREQNHKDLFRASLSMTNMLCVQMMRTEFDPTSAMIPPTEEGDPSDGYPAAVYCNDLPSRWEKDLCNGLGNLMWQMMTDLAGIPSNSLLTNHRLLYAAHELMTRNPDFVRFRYMLRRLETVPVVEGLVAPEEQRQDRVLGILAPKGQKKKPKSPRLMGREELPESIENLKSNEYVQPVLDWDSLHRPTEFCRQLLSAHTFENTREWYDMITGTRMDPTVQSETYDTQWHLIRQRIIELQQERDQAQGKGEGAVSIIESQIDEANQNLWCAHYSMMQARMLEEHKANEVNRQMATCYVCLKSNKGVTRKNICEIFPEKDAWEKVKKLVKTKIKEYVDRVKKIGAKDQKRAGVIYSQWGFRPKEKVICNGALVDPRDADQRVKEDLQTAIAGSAFDKEDCEFTIDKLEKIVEEKLKTLMIVTGNEGMISEECAKLECEGENEDCLKKEAACRKDLMLAFEKLHALVIDESSGSIKESYAVYDSLFRNYGNVGSTPCVDAGMCNVYMEEGLRSWLTRNSISKNGFADYMTGEMPISQLPGLDYAKQLEKLAGGFIPRMESNPAYGLMGKWES